MKPYVKIIDARYIDWEDDDIGIIDGYLVIDSIPRAIIINPRTKQIVFVSLNNIEFMYYG